MKQCTKCKKWKDESKFHEERKSEDGLQRWCKECRRRYDRKYYKRHKKTTRRNYSYEESHRTVSGVKQKHCSKCKRWKAESKFVKHSTHGDGLRYWCIECERGYKRKYYKRNRKGARKNLRYEKRHRIVNRVKQKRCSRCKKWKAEREFYKDKLRKDGLKFRCKECTKKANRNYHKKRRKAVRN